MELSRNSKNHAKQKLGETSSENKNLLAKLYGKLIGLARTMVSNDDLVTETTTLTLLEGLVFCKENLSWIDVKNANLKEDMLNSDKVSVMIERVTEEKKKLAPNCFYCMASCGKNDDYTLENLKNLNDSLRTIKIDMISSSFELASYSLNHRDDVVDKFIIKLLFAIGMDDWDEELLLPIVHESGELYERISISRR